MNEKSAFESLVHRLETGHGDVNTDQPLPHKDQLEERLERFFDNPYSPLYNIPDSLRIEAANAIANLYSTGNISSDSLAANVSYEAIVIADGSRPIGFFQNDSLSQIAGEGQFVSFIQDHQETFERASQSVGRIELSSDYPAPEWTDRATVGTGFYVGNNYILTNRHVVQAMTGKFYWGRPHNFVRDLYVNFDGQLKTVDPESGRSVVGAKRFKVEKLVWTTTRRIATDRAIFKTADLALLEIGDPEDQSTELPSALSLTSTIPAEKRNVAVVGFPGKPKSDAISTENVLSERSGGLEEVFVQLFDRRFGFKRIAAGEIDSEPGFLPRDPKSITVGHDATTLGGNSGSPLFVIDEASQEPLVCACHFGGISEDENFAHTMDCIREEMAAFGVDISHGPMA